jgi:hypothetical protein
MRILAVAAGDLQNGYDLFCFDYHLWRRSHELTWTEDMVIVR